VAGDFPKGEWKLRIGWQPSQRHANFVWKSRIQGGLESPGFGCYDSLNTLRGGKAVASGMAARSEISKWLQQIRRSWLAFAQLAVWLGGVLGGFLMPPPVGISAGEEKVWLRLGQFIVAVVLGLVFLAARRWNQRRHIVWWCGVALLSLSFAIGAFFRYQYLTLAWTGSYVGEKVVIGSVHTPQGLAYATRNPNVSRDDLIFDFAGKTEDIWTRDSINRRRLILAATYISCLPLFAICVIAVVQSVQCGSDQKRRKKTKMSRRA
jgi:hypothetical protein